MGSSGKLATMWRKQIDAFPPSKLKYFSSIDDLSES